MTNQNITLIHQYIINVDLSITLAPKCDNIIIIYTLLNGQSQFIVHSSLSIVNVLLPISTAY